MTTRYVDGTAPDQNPAQKPQEGAQQQEAGISGTTHSRKRTSKESHKAHIESIRELLRK
jgi:hypothetical protein